jgi:nucleotide-binding universal stress UspA family protein
MQAPPRGSGWAGRRKDDGDVILVTTDGSRRSLRVLPHAARLAAVTRTSLLLTRVLDPLTDCGDVVAPSLAEATRVVSARWQKELDALAAGSGVAATASVVVKARQESLAHAIMRHAEEREVRLIAIATQGGGFLRRVALGSVAVGVLTETTLPVLLGGPKLRAPQDAKPYRVLVTTDGSHAAGLTLPGLRHVLELAPSADVALELLRVHEAAFYQQAPALALAESDKQLAAFRRRAPRRFAIESEVREAERHGRVPEEILASAEAHHADAVWMSTHGASWSHQVLVGSIALAMVERSPVPVVLTRARE